MTSLFALKNDVIIASFRSWTVSAESNTNCTIVGTHFQASEAADWNCELGSYPIENEGNTYSQVQKFFQLTILKAATIDRTQLPPDTQLTDGERIDFKIQVDNEDAFPLPTYQWYLDNNPVTLEPRSSNPLEHVVSYQATLADTGKSLACVVTQEDDEGNKIENRSG